MFDRFWHKWLRRPYRLRVVADNGKGPAVILLHGIASEGEIWRPLLRHINPDKHRVIALDLLGFGGSPRPDWPDYTVDDHAQAVLETLKKLRIQGTWTLVAHSMGCLIATHIATTERRRVKRLILYQPPLFADDPAYQSHKRRTARYFAFYTFLANHPELLMLQHRRLYRTAQRLSGLILGPETWLPFERSLRNTIMRQQAYAELHTIAIPTDIIHGRLDFVVVRAEVKKMFQNNPHVTLHIVNEFHDVTEKAARHLNRILESTPGRVPL